MCDHKLIGSNFSVEPTVQFWEDEISKQHSLYINHHSTAVCVCVQSVFMLYVLILRLAAICALLYLECKSVFIEIINSPASNDTNITSGNGSISPSSCWLVQGAIASINAESCPWGMTKWNTETMPCSEITVISHESVARLSWTLSVHAILCTNNCGYV